LDSSYCPTIWAGSQYGGLYYFLGDIWLKSDKLTNVSINDIKADPDSGIWIAQSGTQGTSGGASNIAGGVNYLSAGFSDIGMDFYSVQGTTTLGFLLSRNARSLYIDQNYTQKKGLLPRVWVAQGAYITSSETKRGGLSIGLNQYSPYFTTYSGGYATSSSDAPISEAVGGNGEEVWIAARNNNVSGNGVTQLLRYNPTGAYIGAYTSANVPVLPAGFRAQAIYFDKSGNRWVGLQSGGLAIKTAKEWKSMNNASLLPAGTQINFNAITSDEYDNVYIGTSNGLLQYKSKDYYPASSPENPDSYIRYTTADTLPSNNITGLAYDKHRGKLIIASDAGVTFMNTREDHIKGVVLDVYAGLDDTLRTYTGLQKKPLRGGGLLIARLLRNNEEQDFVLPDENGVFEFKYANDYDLYTVEIKYVEDGKTILYKYDNIRNHTLMQPILIPVSLVKEIKAFKPKMEQRCFPLGIYFKLNIPNAFCTNLVGSGTDFNTDSYDLAYSYLYQPQGVTSDHTKRVENLADYYTSLATVYSLGGNYTEILGKAVENLFDATQAIFDLNSVLKAKPITSLNKSWLKDGKIKEAFAERMKALRDVLSFGLNKGASLLNASEDTKKIILTITTITKEISDVLLEGIKNGVDQGVMKALYDNLKKVAALATAVSLYKNYYAQDRHANLISTASAAAYAKKSEATFEEVYNSLYNLNLTTSLQKNASDTLKLYKSKLDALKDIATLAEIAANAATAAQALAIIPGGQPAATIAAGIARGAKATKVAALAVAAGDGAYGATLIARMSDRVLAKAGLARPLIQQDKITSVSLSYPDSLVARKNRYNQRLTEMQAIYTSPTYDSLVYLNKLIQLNLEDSLYNDALNSTLNTLMATLESANANIPGFSTRLNFITDSFVTQQSALRDGLFFNNLAFVLATDKTAYAPGLDSLGKEIKLANDSAVNGLISLFNSINAANIPAQAYLAVERYVLNHTHAPNSAGSVVYYFKNYGGETQNNVSFKIAGISGGYRITGADSVNVGSLAPGQTKQVTFNFLSPAYDSLGHYEIKVYAANGSFSNVTGALYVDDPTKFYSVQDGNWNDPDTWNRNAVPGAANKVYVSHLVTVNTDATVKELTVNYPGDVKVNTGNRLNITK
jgi:cob(I)alamin adenosyltransferase